MKRQILVCILGFISITSINVFAQTDNQANPASQDSMRSNKTMSPDMRKPMQPNLADTTGVQDKKPVHNNRSRSDSNYSNPDKGKYNRDKNVPVLPPDSLHK